MEDQPYVLYDTPLDYVHQPFTIVPSQCEFDVVYTYVTLSDGDTAVSQNVVIDEYFKVDWRRTSPRSLFPLGQTETVTATATSKT